MARIEIEDWQITIAAESKFWSHGIDRQQVFAVLNHRSISMRNRAGRAAPFVLVGRDDQGGALHCNSHRADQSPGNLATDHGLVLQAE